MKILITGIAGFLGSHLGEHFIKKGHEVIGVDNLMGGDRENIPEQCEFHEGDTRNLELMKKITIGVDLVYHCACSPHEGLSMFSPTHITNHTYANTVPLITASVNNKVKRFVYCSSMSRYGTNKTPFKEYMTPNPQDPYAISKVAAEETLKTLSPISNMEWVIVVPHNIIGTRQKYDDPYRNVASIMINRVLQGKQPIIYGDGSQTRCFSYISDNIKCLAECATSNKVVGEVINIGGDEETVTIEELARTICELLEVDFNPEYYPDRPGEVKHAHTSSDKARRLLDYKTGTTLREELQRMINYIKERGAKEFVYHKELEIINDKTPKTWKEKRI